MKKLLNYYKSLPVAVRAALWFTICNVVQKGISFVTIPIFTRVMTETQYGVTSVYNAWSSIFCVLVTLNLSMGVYNNGMVKFEEDRDGFTSALTGLSTTIAVVYLTVVLAFRDQIAELMGLPVSVVITMFAVFLVSPATDLWSSKQRFAYSYKPLISVTLINTVLVLAISLVSVLTFQDKGVAKIISSAVAAGTVSIILYILIFKKGRTFFNKKYWKYVLAFNIPMIPHYLSSIVLAQADRIMIDWFCGKEEAAIYSIAYALALTLYLVCSAVGNAFIPWLYRCLKAKSCKNVSPVFELLAILIGGIALLLILVAPEMIKIMAPPSYYEAVWIVPPITLGAFFLFIYQMFSNVEVYYEKKYFISIASICCALLNIVLNYIFIRLYGYLACGYTTFVSYLIFAIVHFLFCSRVYRKNNNGERLYNAGALGIICLCVTALSFCMTALYDIIIARYAVAVALGVVFFIKRKYFIGKLSVLKKGENEQ